MIIPGQGVVPRVGIENFDELFFARAVFDAHDDYGPTHSVLNYLDNANSLISGKKRSFPVWLVGKEALVADSYMTEGHYEDDPLWGELAESLRIVKADLGHTATDFLYSRAA